MTCSRCCADLPLDVPPAETHRGEPLCQVCSRDATETARLILFGPRKRPLTYDERAALCRAEMRVVK